MRIVDILIISLLILSGIIWVLPKIYRALRGRIESVSAMELFTRLEAGEELVIIDVRENKDFNNFLGHIVHSINIPFLKLRERLEKSGSDLSGFFDVPVIIVEPSEGLKGAKAYKMLKAHGFKKVKLLDGGFAEWVKNKLPATRYEG